MTKECLKLLIDEWLVKCCDGDPIELLKYLDVETYESVGESVMEAVLKAGLVKVQEGQSICQFLVSNSNTTEGLYSIVASIFSFVCLQEQFTISCYNIKNPPSFSK